MDLLLKSPKSDNSSVQKVFPDIGSNVTAEVTKTKSFLSKLTGYEGTITLTDESTKANSKINKCNKWGGKKIHYYWTSCSNSLNLRHKITHKKAWWSWWNK